MAMRLDDDAFRAWVAESHGAALRLARRMVGSDADAEDVVQESYVRAYVALRGDRFRSGPEALTPWLRRIVTRVGLDALRARRRSLESSEAPIDEVPAPGRTDAGVDRASLERALAELPVAQRTAFVLREIEGFSLEETAEALHCTVGAVEQRVLRAWAGLKRRLHDEPR